MLSVIKTNLCSQESCLYHSEYCLQWNWLPAPVLCRDLSSCSEPLSGVSLPNRHSVVSGSARCCGSPSLAHLPVSDVVPAAKNVSEIILNGTLHCYTDVISAVICKVIMIQHPVLRKNDQQYISVKTALVYYKENMQNTYSSLAIN